MNKTRIRNLLCNLKNSNLSINGLIKRNSYILKSTSINYTNTPTANAIYNTCFIPIPESFSKITLKTNNENTLGQPNAYIIFTNDYSSSGTRILKANVTYAEITLDHNYKYIAIPLGINSNYPITNNFYSFDTATFEFS